MSVLVQELGQRFATAHPEQAARALEFVTPEDVAVFLDTVGAQIAGGLIRHMNPPQAVACLSASGVERSAEMCSLLPRNVAAALLRRMRRTTVEAILEHVGQSNAAALRRLLRFTEGTAAAVADPDVLTLPSDIDIGEARKQLRRSAALALYNIYVIDREQHLVGVLPYRKLFLTPPSTPLRSVMQTELVTLAAQNDLATVAAHPAWREFDALPVVDRTGLFLGVVRHKRLRQIFDSATADVIPGLAILTTMAEWYWTSLTTLIASLTPAAEVQVGKSEADTWR